MRAYLWWAATTQTFDADEVIDSGLTITIILYALFSLLMGAYYILFGMGLLKLKNKIAYAKTAGILDIVAGTTFIIFIGWLVALAGFISEIVVLFSASKKFER